MRAEAFVHRDGTGTFTSDDGTVELIDAGTPAAARAEVLQLAAAVAARAKCTVEVEAIIAGERSIIQVAETGEVGRTPSGEDPGARPASDALARNDAQGLLAAGVRPAALFDADALASARLRMLEQAGFVVAEPPPASVVAAAQLATAPPAAPPAKAPPTHRERRKRPVILLASTAALLVLGGTGIALAATGRHGTPSLRPTPAASARSVASVSPVVPLPPVSPAAASTVETAASQDTLAVEVVGRVGRVVVRAADLSAASLTVRLVAAGAAPIEQAVDLAPPGPTTVRISVPAATYDWSVSASDGQTQHGQVTVTAVPSPTPTAARPPRAATPHPALTQRPAPSRSPQRTPKHRSTPKPKVHASVPPAPLERSIR